MKNPFDKDFFKFLVGLAVILVIGFTVIVMVGGRQSGDPTKVADVNTQAPAPAAVSATKNH